MNQVSIHCESIEVALKAGPDIMDITHQLEQVVVRAQIRNGTVNATMIGSTGSLTTIEFEPGVVADLKRVIMKLVPPDEGYEHELAWQDGNGHSHVQAAIIGPSVNLPLRNGQMVLGTWQQVVAVNHDRGERKRTIEVTIVGV